MKPREFEDRNENQLNVVTNKKHNLHRNILIKLIILYGFIIIMVYIILKEINLCTDDPYLTYYLGRFINRKELFKVNKQIIAMLLIINNISIGFFKENRTRLKTLFKFSKEQMKEIEEKTIEYEKENVSFGGKYKICFSEESLILMKNADFKIINYNDIIYVLDTKNYFFAKEREICIVTKTKKIIKIGNVIHRKELKNKLLDKNPKIIFKNSTQIRKKETLNLVGLNINNILLKDIAITFYKVWSITIAVYPAVYYLINHKLLTDILTAHDIIDFIIFSPFFFLIYCGVTYQSSKIKK